MIYYTFIRIEHVSMFSNTSTIHARRIMPINNNEKQSEQQALVLTYSLETKDNCCINLSSRSLARKLNEEANKNNSSTLFSSLNPAEWEEMGQTKTMKAMGFPTSIDSEVLIATSLTNNDATIELIRLEGDFSIVTNKINNILKSDVIIKSKKKNNKSIKKYFKRKEKTQKLLLEFIKAYIVVFCLVSGFAFGLNNDWSTFVSPLCCLLMMIGGSINKRFVWRYWYHNENWTLFWEHLNIVAMDISKEEKLKEAKSKAESELIYTTAFFAILIVSLAAFAIDINTITEFLMTTRGAW